MRNKQEIQNKIDALEPEVFAAEESYYSMINEKQTGGRINESDFLKIESEYEILKKEIETLQWVLNEEE
jgi:hypothetical protein